MFIPGDAKGPNPNDTFQTYIEEGSVPNFDMSQQVTDDMKKLWEFRLQLGAFNTKVGQPPYNKAELISKPETIIGEIKYAGEWNQ